MWFERAHIQEGETMSQPEFLPLGRRQWLKTAVATTAGSSLMATHAHAALSSAPAQPAVRVVFDRRLTSASAFAANAGAMGLRSAGIDGDVTQLWFQDLAPVASRQGLALLGHTALMPKVCLEQMAADHWHAVRVSIEHVPGTGGMEHRITAPPAAIAGLQRWFASAPDWRSGLATTLFAALETGLRGRQVHAVVRSAGQTIDAGSVTWLLARA
jgi:hypothetical protein